MIEAGPELIPLLQGLVTSILPGLDEQDENLQKMVMRFLNNIKAAVGQKFLVDCVWLAILKSPKVRISGIKYLNKEMKNRVALEAGENSSENYEKFYLKSKQIMEHALQK